MRAKVVKDGEYEGMFRIKFPGGELSDMYNLSRAKNHLTVWKETEARTRRRMAGKGPRKGSGCV